jgi:PLP dependent protein
MMTLDSLNARYRDVTERVGAAAVRSGRKPSDVMVVAVSKYAELDQIRELIALGHMDFGESRAQSLIQRAAVIEEIFGRQLAVPQVAAAQRAARSKQQESDGLPTLPPATRVRWHMIGHLQRNKARKIVDLVRLVHSVDSLRIAEELQTIAYLQRNKVKKVVGLARLIHSVDSLRLIEEIQAAASKRDEVVEILIQVNCSEEPQKFGCAVAAAMHLCEQAESSIHLRVRGFMTMAPHSVNPEDSRPTFDRCRDLFSDAKRHGVGGAHFNILSMGMSNDFEVAIDCGSNLVRVGSAIFGESARADADEDESDED